MAKVVAVCTSEEKGTVKIDQRKGVIRENYGLEGDAHADSGWHRQVSLLAIESIDKMRKKGLELKYGDFAENLTTEGIELYSLPIGTCLAVGDEVILEITQIGKECHTGCAIRQLVGDCIMPREGVFAKVLKGGKVKAGDEIEIKELRR